MKHNIGQHLKKRADISADKEAFVEFEQQRRFTYKELNTRSNRTANYLLSLTIKPGDRVAVLLRNSIEFVECYFAIAKIGAVMVPINWRLTAAEINYILQDADVSLLIFDAEFNEVIETLRQDHSPAVNDYLRVSTVGDHTPLPDFCQCYNRCTDASSCDEPTITTGDDDLLFIMYTSGTTGHPKGAMQSHRCMLWAELTSMSTSDMRGDDRFLLPMPMFHVGCLVPVSQLVHRGATGVIMRDIDMDTMFKAIQEERITITMSVPALLQFILHAPQRQQYKLDSIRWIATGAAPVPVSLLNDFANIGIAIYQAYGLTESCGPGTLLLPENGESKAGSCGKPQMHTQARVIDEKGQDIEPGSETVGELLLAGEHIMLGYWNNPEATAGALKDGWLYTGDLCTIDNDGFIFICDRKKDMVISGGENIYPAEIENILAAHPQIQESAVIGVPSQQWGETPLAIIVTTDGQSIDSESLQTYCRQHLASYKVPKLYEFVTSLPRNPSGKLLKPQLRKQFPGPAPF